MTKKIEFADELFTDAYLPQFVEEFSTRVLGIEWDEVLFVSDESSVFDFTMDNREEIIARIQREYGVDCSDLKLLNLGEVMQRCANQATRPLQS